LIPPVPWTARRRRNSKGVGNVEREGKAWLTSRFAAMNLHTSAVD